MSKSKRAMYRDPRVSWLSVLLLSAACSGGSGDSADASPAASGSIGFANDDSDVVAVLPDGPAGDFTIVIMRADDAARGRDVGFVGSGGTDVEAIADADGRLGELRISANSFVFTAYTATQVTVTYHAVGGETETWEQDLAGTVAMSSQALTEEKPRSIDQDVDATLKWVADPSNTYLPLVIHRKLGEDAVKLFEKVRTQVNTLRKKATELAMVVHNKLECATQKRTGCAVQVAEGAQTLAKELRAVDPDAKTTAGFKVDITHIRAIRADWDPLIMNGMISTDFTLKDVPCSESVFAELNPDCPQYVAPGKEQDAGSPDGGGTTSDLTRLCKQTLDGNQFKFNCKMASLGTCEDSGWTFFGTYDDVLACASDIPATAAQVQKGDLSPGPNSNEATGKSSVGPGGTGDCLSGTWKTPACDGTVFQQLTFGSGTGKYSNPDCNGICTDLIFPFDYTVSGDSVTLHYTDPPQPTCTGISNPPQLQKPATDDTFTFTCEGGSLKTTSSAGTTTYTR